MSYHHLFPPGRLILYKHNRFIRHNFTLLLLFPGRKLAAVSDITG